MPCGDLIPKLGFESIIGEYYVVLACPVEGRSCRDLMSGEGFERIMGEH
jgi:hypothetical protein